MIKPQRRRGAEKKTQQSGKLEDRNGEAARLSCGKPSDGFSTSPEKLIQSAAPPRPGGSRSILRARLVRWFRKNARDLPWRRTCDPYAILVSEIMLQQTQVAAVIPFYERWMKRFPDVETLAGAGETDILELWQGLGYYSRARNLHRAAQMIVTQHGRKFPRALESIRALRGIGRYTAGAVATFAFDQATPIVDANIARVLARIFEVEISIDSSAGQSAIWHYAEALQPQKNARLFNGALMELGALICTPRAPKCLICPVAEFCIARTQNPERLPLKRARRKTQELIENCALTISGGKILLEQQTGARWRGMWKLPAISVAAMPNEEPLVQLEYPFTHHRVKLSVFKVPAAMALTDNQRWHRLDALETIAIPSPHRRALSKTLSS